MAVDKDNVVLSDTEGGEKSAREKLKKANIHDPNAARTDSDIEDAPAPTSAGSSEPTGESDEARGRVQRKRSFEEIDPEQTEPVAPAHSKLHNRKRSRDSTAEEYALNNGQRKASGERSRNGEDIDGSTEDANGKSQSPRAATPDVASEKEAAVETLASPKTKRSRLHSTTDDAEAIIAENASLSTSSVLAEQTAASTAESKADLQEGSAGKLPPGSAFGNTSASSPFGTISGSNSLASGTSTSAFASSKFGALAGSSASGFGALGKSTGGPGLGGGFGSGARSPIASSENETPRPAGSAFGGALGQQSAFASTLKSGSGFGSRTSGFSSLGGSSSGFGGGMSATGFSSLGGGGLSSFASGRATALSGSGSKAFGAAGDDDDPEDGAEDEEDGAGYKSALSQESDQQDERFYAQDIETGEEGESTEMTCRAKLYNFAAGEHGKKEWRERGVGILRLNVQRPLHDDDDETKTSARLLMRADGSHRVLLNTPILPQIKFGQPDGSRPNGSYVYFMGTIDDKTELQLLQLKVKAVNALELFDKVKALQEEM